MRSCLLFLSVVLITACSKYSYITVTGDVPANANGDLTFSTDSVEVSYHFEGEDAGMTVRIKNLTSKPFFVDWGYSSIIRNGESVSLRRRDASLSGHVNIQGTGNLDGTVTLPTQASIIPPGAFVTSDALKLGHIFPEKKDAVPCDRVYGYARCANYSHESSPYQFRSYLVLSGTPDYSGNIIVEQKFWIGRLEVGSVHPRDYKIIYNKPAVAYSQKFTGFGKVATGAGILGVLVAAALLQSTGPE